MSMAVTSTSVAGKPPGRIPPETTRVHGITDADVRGAGDFAQHVAGISSMMEDSVIVGHNVLQFDWRFLEMECMRVGVEAPARGRHRHSGAGEETADSGPAYTRAPLPQIRH
ncbi:MAG: hypothetical protein Ct9H300mP30_2040 [Methanobacteriota archaeon]|nr:MAG: hypothetical protein Ct9H300mP30_2040 [Euryarchaeota archaeon]